MSNIEIVVDTYNDFITYEQWLFNITPPEKDIGVCIYCKENMNSYFYNVVNEFFTLRFVTNGEIEK